MVNTVVRFYGPVLRERQRQKDRNMRTRKKTPCLYDLATNCRSHMESYLLHSTGWDNFKGPLWFKKREYLSLEVQPMSHCKITTWNEIYLGEAIFRKYSVIQSHNITPPRTFNSPLLLKVVKATLFFSGTILWRYHG